MATGKTVGYHFQMDCLDLATHQAGPMKRSRVHEEEEGMEENGSKRFVVGSAGRNRVSRLRIGQSWVFSMGYGS